MLTNKEFSIQLKADADENKFTIQGNYIVFDNTANLSYQIIPHFTLGELLTKNPVASFTKLNKDLILRLWAIREALNAPLIINSSYRSPEYNKTVVGSSPTSNHCKGDALDLGFSDPQKLHDTIVSLALGGELGVYNWGCHTAVSAVAANWDNRAQPGILRKVKDYITNDSYRNYAAYAVLAIFGYFFIIKRFI